MAKVDQLVESIVSINGITKLIVATRDGNILTKQGVKGEQFGSFITFVAITADHIRALMGFNGPSHIILNQGSGEKLLILPGPKVIVGLEITSSVSPLMVVDSLKPLINRLTLD